VTSEPRAVVIGSDLFKFNTLAQTFSYVTDYSYVK